MPYASQHYPFEHADEFRTSMFPADFIAEGLDQTRGWFYTLAVLGIKMFNTFPFKNCIVNGIILAEDGKKMSKKEKNYPDPSLVITKYGADALRLYMISSPVVRAESLRFKETGLREIVGTVLRPLWNSYKFFEEQITLLKKSKDIDFVFDPEVGDINSLNVMDRWILAECQSLLVYVDQEMAGKPQIKLFFAVCANLRRLSSVYRRSATTTAHRQSHQLVHSSKPISIKGYGRVGRRRHSSCTQHALRSPPHLGLRPRAIHTLHHRPHVPTSHSIHTQRPKRSN